MGVREEVERRPGTAVEQRGRGRETEKEIGKHKLNEVETASVQLGQGTRSRTVLNWLDKDYEVVIHRFLTSLIAQSVKNLPAMQEPRVQFPGGEDLLEKKWQPGYSSILAWRIPWTEEPGGLQFIGSQESDTT